LSGSEGVRVLFNLMVMSTIFAGAGVTPGVTYALTHAFGVGQAAQSDHFAER
jgi:hypothetical protein